MESTSEAAPLSAPMAIDTWLSAADGDASGLWFLSLMARMAFPESFIWGELAAVSRADTSAADRYFAKGAHRSDSILGNAGTEFLYAGGGLAHAFPPAPDAGEYTRVQDSDVETLLVGGTLDFATPPRFATQELLPHLRNGHQVVLAELGHASTFWSYEPKASTRLLNTFFDSGRVDTSLYTPAKVDFTPDVTQTALGKGFAGTMLGLPVVVLLSLLLMRRRVRRRGRFGRTASVLLRSLYTVVLGLGGWFAGVVVVQLAFPEMPLDDVLLAVLSIGVPIGLGVYLAWVGRDLPARLGRSACAARLAVPSPAPGSGFTRGPVFWPSSPRSSERPSARISPCSAWTSRGIGPWARSPSRQRESFRPPGPDPGSHRAPRFELATSSPPGRVADIVGGGARWLGSAVSGPAAAWLSGRPRQRLGTGWAQIQRPALPGESR